MAGTSRPSSAAIAAAASALETWWPPCSRRCTSAPPPAAIIRNEARPRSSRLMAAARTSAIRSAVRAADALNRLIRARVRAAIAATLASSALRIATPSAGSASTSSPLALATASSEPNSPGVGAADVEHRADPRRGDVAQLGDVADAAGRHLQHQVPGRLVGPEHGQRQAELVVEGADGGDRRAEPVDHLGGEVLGRGLARRPGDPDDGRGRQPAQHLPGERAEGGGHVGGDDHRHVGARRGSGGGRAPRPRPPWPPRRRSRGRPPARPAGRRTARPAPPRASRITTGPVTRAGGPGRRRSASVTVPPTIAAISAADSAIMTDRSRRPPRAWPGRPRPLRCR